MKTKPLSQMLRIILSLVIALSLIGCGRYTKEEGQNLKMLRTYETSDDDALVKEISLTLFDQAERHPNCSTYELLVRVDGTTNETKVCGNDLVSIRKCKDADEIAVKFGPSIVGQLHKDQIGKLVKILGSYEGPARPHRIMGAMMTGVWKLVFFQDESGALKCKGSLRLHDEENGWGNPKSTTVLVKILAGSNKDEVHLRAFSDDAPKWLVAIDGVSLSAGQPIDAITLLDMDSEEIRLERK